MVIRRFVLTISIIMISCLTSSARYAHFVLFHLLSPSHDLSIGLDVSYGLGSASNCPQISGKSSYLSRDTMYVNVYYNLTGAWHAQGCSRKDTVNIINTVLNYKYINVKYNEVLQPDENDLTIYDTLPNFHDTTFILSSTGMGSSGKDYSLELYPNPAKHMVQIKTAGVSLSDIQLIDNWGRIVLSLTAQGDTKTIDLRGISRGAYQIKVGMNNGQIHRRIIVLN